MLRKNRRRQRSQDTPATIQEWMERTGTNGRQLLQLMKAHGEPITEGHLSNILKGSRRCSLSKAIVLNEITGVSIRAIARWPRTGQNRTILTPAIT